jgi:hypothetical protein
MASGRVAEERVRSIAARRRQRTVPAIAIFAVPAHVENRNLRRQLMQPGGDRARHGLLLKRLPSKALKPRAGRLGTGVVARGRGARRMVVPALIYLAVTDGERGCAAGACQWRPTLRSRSACWRCSETAYRSASRYSCWRWRSSAISARCWWSRCSTPRTSKTGRVLISLLVWGVLLAYPREVPSPVRLAADAPAFPAAAPPSRSPRGRG